VILHSLYHGEGYLSIDEKIKDKYLNQEPEVFDDDEKGLKYVIINGKRMYLARGMSDSDIRQYVNGIMLEQSPTSPHRYLTSPDINGGVVVVDIYSHNNEEPFEVEAGDVVFDVGSAEGIFALAVIHKARKVYIFECKDSWCEALRATFELYGDKAEIINKAVSDIDSSDTVSLDSFIRQRDIKLNFLKVDIEGCEEAMLRGATETLENSNRLKIALCTYHRLQDADLFSKLLSQSGFRVAFTDGYLGIACGKRPYLRKCLLRAEKEVI
jgi:predicted RNA methylase